jgi:hypothetical protein
LLFFFFWGEGRLVNFLVLFFFFVVGFVLCLSTVVFSLVRTATVDPFWLVHGVQRGSGRGIFHVTVAVNRDLFNNKISANLEKTKKTSMEVRKGTEV